MQIVTPEEAFEDEDEEFEDEFYDDEDDDDDISKYKGIGWDDL